MSRSTVAKRTVSEAKFPEGVPAKYVCSDTDLSERLSETVVCNKKDLIVNTHSTPRLAPLNRSFDSYIKGSGSEITTSVSSNASFLSVGSFHLPSNSEIHSGTIMADKSINADDFLGVLQDERVKNSLANILSVSIQPLRESVTSHEKRITAVEQRLDDLELRNRNYFLFIDGQPESQGENLKEIVCDIARTKLNVALVPGNIEFAARAKKGRENEPKSIQVKFYDLAKKTEFYIARMKLVGHNPPLYIREFLTPIRANIDFKLRKA